MTPTALLFTALLTLGQTAKIVAPAQVAPGDLVVLDATASVGTGYAWTVIPAKTFLPVDGGTKAVFSSGSAGTYVFVLAVADGGKAAITQHTLTVGVAPAPEPPTPGPTPPTPTPPGPTPTGVYSKLAYETAKAIGKPDEAKKLAGAARGVSGAIAGGTINSIEQTLVVWRDNNAASMTVESFTVWASWSQALSDLLKKELGSKAFDKQAWAAAFAEIAQGTEQAGG